MIFADHAETSLRSHGRETAPLPLVRDIHNLQLRLIALAGQIAELPRRDLQEQCCRLTLVFLLAGR